MRFLKITLLLSTVLFAQEKSKIIFSNETVFINYNKDFNIQSKIQESRQIAKSRNVSEYRIQIPFDSFNEISDVQGSTFLVTKNKKRNLRASDIGTYDVIQDNIFKSDYKYKNFTLPDVEDNSIIEFSYKNTLKEPRFLSSFRFQHYLKTETSTLVIKCNSKIEIGYKIFGNFQEKIMFSKTKEGEFDVYTWKANDLPEFKMEENMPSSSNFMPHIIYYIKSYNNNGVTTRLLGTPENLYNWYQLLLKNLNGSNQNSLEEKTLDLIKNEKTAYDKAKIIYNWVQYNLHYVAFENGMNGFVPKDAADVFQKKYGDCKDMANLLNEMLHYAGIDSNLTWIGTRDKTYTYADVPTPVVDNHMIVNAQIDGKSYFLDSTDKFCPFGFPSAMIQGKEALIGLGENNFRIEVVNVVEPINNKINIDLKLAFSDNNLSGEVTTLTSGFCKSDLLNRISVYTQDEPEFWKAPIIMHNKKITLVPKETSKNEYLELPAKSIHELHLENGVLNLSDKIMFKPIIIFPFKESEILIMNRQYPVEFDYAKTYEIKYEYKLPKGYKLEFVPNNAKFSNDLGNFDFEYKLQKDLIIISQKVQIKKIVIENNDFEKWNLFIKTLNKQYNQSLFLIK